MEYLLRLLWCLCLLGMFMMYMCFGHILHYYISCDSQLFFLTILLTLRYVRIWSYYLSRSDGQISSSIECFSLKKDQKLPSSGWFQSHCCQQSCNRSERTVTAMLKTCKLTQVLKIMKCLRSLNRQRNTVTKNRYRHHMQKDHHIYSQRRDYSYTHEYWIFWLIIRI